MAYLTWRREWDTGIAVIDKQHCRIVELINELHQARENGGGREAVAEVLRDLVDYTATHFSFEEELQAQAGYPFARAHKRLHEMFIKKVAGYQEKFAAGEDIVLEVLSTMEKWLIHHIKGDDADYVSLVRERLFADGNSSPGWLGGMLGKFFNTKEA